MLPAANTVRSRTEWPIWGSLRTCLMKFFLALRRSPICAVDELLINLVRIGIFIRIVIGSDASLGIHLYRACSS